MVNLFLLGINMYDTVKEYIEGLSSRVSKEELEILYDLLKYSPMRQKERVKFCLIYEMIKDIDTEHEKIKNFCLSRCKHLINHYVEDFTLSLSRRQLKTIADVNRVILDRLGIYLTGLSMDKYLYLEDRFKDISFTVLLDIEEEIEDGIRSDNYKEVYKLLLETDIEFFDYNSLNNIEVQEEWQCGAERPLGGGGCDHLLSRLIKTLVNIRTKRYLTFNGFSGFSKFNSKLSRLLTHIHFSWGDSVVIPRYFLEDNGYETLTEMVLLDTETGREYRSLDILEGLGLASVSSYNQEKGRAREVTLTQLGKAVGASLGLSSKRISLNELKFREGDLTSDRQDYQYYIDEGYLPNYTLINPLLKSLETTKLNITEYTDSFAEKYPIIEYELEEYTDYLEDNMFSIELDNNIKVLSNYAKDIRNLTTGLSIKRKYKKIGKQRQLIVELQNVWKLSYTGRLFQRQGLQGISRESKDIVHTGSYNYDIPNSQLLILKQLLEEVYDKYSYLFDEEDRRRYSNLGWITSYSLNKNSIIKKVGIDPSDWKVSIYSIVFGSNLFLNRENSVINTIVARNRLNKDFDLTEYYETLKPLSDLMTLWFKYVENYKKDYKLSPYSESILIRLENTYDLSIDGSRYIYNGLMFIDKRDKLFDSKKRLSAFLLQGIEASFILTLSMAVRKDTLSYEFDGLVTNKPIAEELIEEARRVSGFKYGTVIVKSFI